MQIDLVLIGSQKALSCPPSLAAVVVSPLAWASFVRVAYQGYDALLPFRDAWSKRLFPYTHNWSAVAALRVAIAAILTEGLSAVYARHVACAHHCRSRVVAMGLEVPLLNPSA